MQAKYDGPGGGRKKRMCLHSSVGQSMVLITPGSQVRALLGVSFFSYLRLRLKVLVPNDPVSFATLLYHLHYLHHLHVVELQLQHTLNFRSGFSASISLQPHPQFVSNRTSKIHK